MSVEKSFLRIKTLRLFIVCGAFSTVILVLIYSLPNNEKELTTKFNQGLFSTWPIKSSNILQINNKKGSHVLGISEKHQLKLLGKASYAKSNTERRQHVLRNKIKHLTSNRHQDANLMQFLNSTHGSTNYSMPNIHIFYTMPIDWSKQSTAFYPLLDMYEATNKTIRHHFKNIQLLGANVLIISWSPSPSPQDQLLPHLFDEAHNFGIRIAIEIDDYANRTAFSIFNDIHYFYKCFWQHKSLYKVFVTSKSNFLPMFYIKSIDTIAGNEWKKLLAPNGEMSLRSALHDAVFVGHISSRKDVSLIKTSNFNGFYSRMVSNGATFASTWKYWPELQKTANKFRLLFIPTIGPGYDEKSKKSKIASTRRHRTNGQYYGVGWRAAISIGAEFVNIASYNDWHAGTQIEEAIPKSGYKDYSPGSPTNYIDLTRYWIHEYIQSWQTDSMKRLVDVKLCNSYFNNTVC